MRIGCLILLLCWTARPAAAGSPPVTADEIERIVTRMTEQGASFDAEALLERGEPGLQALLDHVLPVPAPVGASTVARMTVLVAQLGADSFDEREAASARLLAEGRVRADLVQDAAAHADPEIRHRAGEILRRWHALDDLPAGRERRFSAALNAYLRKVSDPARHRTLARHSVRALMARLDQTPRRESLAMSIGALARSNDDDVHEILLPLLDHEDPDVPMFAMKRIAGRTGNSYVAPIHMAALASGRRDLVKCALRSMPCPVWDPRSKPAVRAALGKIIDGSSAEWNFDDDPRFVERCAFVAARDFGLQAATRYLLSMTGSADPEAARRAILALGDSYYRRRPVSPDLLEAVAPHLGSTDADLRYAAVRTLGVYKGVEVLRHLVARLDDRADRVWKEAGRRLVDQHAYYDAGTSPVRQVLEQARDDAATATVRQRIDRMLGFLETSPHGAFDW